MSKQTINIGASPNDGTGTPLRTSFDYTNQNFTELYTALGGGVGLPGATTQVIFNDGGTNLAGDAGLVYNKTTDALTVAGLVTAGSASITGDLTVDTSTLKVDSTNHRVGVGTATPSQPLHVKLDQNAYTFSRIDNQNASSGAYAALMLGASGNSWGIGVGSAAANSNALDFFLDAGGANSLKMTLNTAGNLAFPTGKGIDFSAVTGGTGTATANVLNDYEEGTWTGTLKGSTTDPTIAVTATGRYTKVGRQVSVQIAFETATTTGASGAISISGLPFTNNAGIRAIGTGGVFLGATFTGTMIAEITYSTTSIAYYGINSNAVWSSADHNAGVGRYFWANVTYTV